MRVDGLKFTRVAMSLALTVSAVMISAGCERKEKVVDIQAPGTNVEVERNIDTGEVEVEANRN